MHTEQENERDDARSANVLEMLNTALAMTIAAALRYKHHAFAVRQLHERSIPVQHVRSVSVRFFENAKHKEAHADHLAERIAALGGEPDFNPTRVELRGADRVEEPSVRADTLVEMVRDALGAELHAIDFGVALMDRLGDADPTTGRILGQILDRFEGDAEELRKLLALIDDRRDVERGERRKGDRRQSAGADRRSGTSADRRAAGSTQASPATPERRGQGAEHAPAPAEAEPRGLAGDGIVDDQMTG